MSTMDAGSLDSLRQRYYAKQATIERLHKEQLEILKQVYELANPKKEQKPHE